MFACCLPLRQGACAGWLLLERTGAGVNIKNAVQSAGNFTAIKSYGMLPFKNYGHLMVLGTEISNVNRPELFFK